MFFGFLQLFYLLLNTSYIFIGQVVLSVKQSAIPATFLFQSISLASIEKERSLQSGNDLVVKRSPHSTHG